MLKPQHAVLGLALLLVVVGDSPTQSQQSPSTESQQEQTQSQQPTTSADQRGTEQFPFVVQPLPTKKSAEETAREAREAKEKADSDWWTWFLSVLTVLAPVRTVVCFRRSSLFFEGNP
jgi:hypothetical protein